VKAEAWMPPEPLHDLRIFLRALIVENHVDDLSCGTLASIAAMQVDKLPLPRVLSTSSGLVR
jgi:hypothetical protein